MIFDFKSGDSYKFTSIDAVDFFSDLSLEDTEVWFTDGFFSDTTASAVATFSFFEFEIDK